MTEMTEIFPLNGFGAKWTVETQCAHKTRHSFKSYNKHDTHTLQCCKAKHDDAAHEWKDPVTGRTVIWFNDGPAPEIDYSTRFRFFKDH